MTHATTVHHEKTPDTHQDVFSKTIFGFWVYLMTDCVLFGVLFATYAVLHNNTYGGPSAKEIFHIRYALGETMLLLISSFTCGVARVSAFYQRKYQTIIWFGITFLFGAAFMYMEISEFTHLVQEGNSWQRSAFLSAFFTLVATHGLHISLGLVWIVVLILPVFRHGITPLIFKRLTCLGMFWHFLDVVWVFIFTLVYLMGVN